MKRLLLMLIAVVMTTAVMAQTPVKMGKRTEANAPVMLSKSKVLEGHKLAFDKMVAKANLAKEQAQAAYSKATKVMARAEASTDLVTPPANVEQKAVRISGYNLAWDMPYSGGGLLAIDGNDFYINGLMPDFDAWVKGTLDAEGNVTFVKGQYLGQYYGSDDMWFMASDLDGEEGNLKDAVGTWDEAAQTLSFDDHNVLLENASTEIMQYAAALANITVEPGIEIITEQPEGELKVYARTGGAYYSFMGYVIPTSQNGTMIRVVFAEDGCVYMENPISQAMVEGGTWVKGTREGNKIHMPLGQCVIYFEDYGYGYQTAVLKCEDMVDEWSGETFKTYEAIDMEEVTFTIDEATGTIKLDLVSTVDEAGYADYIMGLVDTEFKMWTDLGDYNSVYTQFDGQYLTMPEGVSQEDWAIMYFDGEYDNANLVKVAVKDDKMYIAGLAKMDPEATIVGTIKDGKVTFASDQFLGTSAGFISYGIFGTYSVETAYEELFGEYDVYNYVYAPEFSLTYDSQAKTLTCGPNSFFILNAGKGADEVLYINAFYNPSFSYFEDRAVKPMNPEVNGFSDWFDDYGYNIFSVNIPLKDVDGKYIAKENTYYIIYVKAEGEVKPFVLTADDYYGFGVQGLDEMTEIPYSFVCYDDCDYEDIAEAGSNVVLYQSGFDDYGVQTVYYGGGERNVSDIVWLSGEVTGINAARTHVATRGIYDLQGRQLSKLQKGLNIIIKDGKPVKMLVK